MRGQGPLTAQKFTVIAIRVICIYITVAFQLRIGLDMARFDAAACRLASLARPLPYIHDELQAFATGDGTILIAVRIPQDRRMDPEGFRLTSQISFDRIFESP